MSALHFVVAAGGTGGHMVPAHVVAGELQKRGHRVTLMTDARGLRFPGLFEGITSQLVESAMFGGRNPLRWLGALATLRRGWAAAQRFLRAEQVSAIVGFGGYPPLPPSPAAIGLRRPTILHEQNAVLGRVNRLLAARAARIALSFEPTERVHTTVKPRTTLTGLPIRAEIAAIAAAPYPSVHDRLDLLVLGGSQGASILSRVVPAAVTLLSPALRARLRITQQCRSEDLTTVRAAYSAQGIDAALETYFADLPARLAAAQLVISRSGASTMAELAAAGRPAILVPFAAATDDHQAANARSFVAAGGGAMLRESEFTPKAVAETLSTLLNRPDALVNAAEAARGVGRPDAGARLADLAVEVALAA